MVHYMLQASVEKGELKVQLISREIDVKPPEKRVLNVFVWCIDALVCVCVGTSV